MKLRSICQARLVATAAVIAFAISVAGCSGSASNSVSENPYPAWTGPYAYAPYDPYGTYLYSPTAYPFPYNYEGYYPSDRVCEGGPCGQSSYPIPVHADAPAQAAQAAAPLAGGASSAPSQEHKAPASARP